MDNADEPRPASGADVGVVTSKRRGNVGNLTPRKKGDPPLNPTGINGSRRRQELVASILDENDDDEPLEPGCSRIRSVVLATVRDAKAGGPGAASAQKVVIEQYGGKATAKIDHTSSDGSMSPIGPDLLASRLRSAIDEIENPSEKTTAEVDELPDGLDTPAV